MQKRKEGYPLVIDHDVAHCAQALDDTRLNVLEQLVRRLHAVSGLQMDVGKHDGNAACVSASLADQAMLTKHVGKPWMLVASCLHVGKPARSEKRQLTRQRKHRKPTRQTCPLACQHACLARKEAADQAAFTSTHAPSCAGKERTLQSKLLW
eukprot:scaffold141342_cov22-Tisochrysis_lutea.AAC.1